MNISVIIPTINEADRIESLISHLSVNGANHLTEIIVADGGSTDGTCEIVRAAMATLLNVGRKSRAIQMNAAAIRASGDILYFVHADTVPPASYAEDIISAVSAGHHVGGFSFKFDRNDGLKKINSWATTLNLTVCRGGDQSMFVTRELFESLNGYDENYVIMEDFDFIRRSKKITHWHILPNHIEVSSRKYDNNSYMRVQLANLMAYTMFNIGASVPKIKLWYERMLRISYK